MPRSLITALNAVAISSFAFAQVSVDGQRLAGEGYTLLSTQTVNTQFGDNLSELNAAWVRVTNAHLYVAIPGNLEANFNKFDLFIDSKAGGFNTLQANPGMDGASALDGLKFDSGFDPDFLVVCRRGNFRFYVDFGQLGSSGSYDSFADVFGTNDFGVRQDLSGSVTTGLDVAYNGLNAGGVSAGTGAANSSDAEAAFEGLEFGIPLADLGWTGGEIKLCAMVVNNNHSFLSNQFLGGLPAGTGNLGFGRDLTALSGDQHFVVPRIDAQVTPCSVTNHSGGFPAKLAAYGSDSVSDNDLSLVVTGLPTTGTTAYLFNAFLAPGQTLSTVPTPTISGVTASGDVCIAGGTFGRHVFGSDIYMGTDGTFTIDVDLADIPSPRDAGVGGNPSYLYSTSALTGETWYWQCWFRDPTSGTGHSNFSEAISVTFQ
jgi:hypothetical protein